MKRRLLIILLAIAAVLCFTFLVSACAGDAPPVNGTDGKDGAPGADGRGIADMSINENGELVIAYSDGTSVNLGKVKGEDGADGEQGAPGKQIEFMYFNTKNELVFKFNDNTLLNLGKVEGTGKDGRGIYDVAFNYKKELIITYTDGSSVNLGKIEGFHGVNGSDGRGIVSVELSSDKQLIITYTDGTQESIGKISGINGADGRGIAGISLNADNELVVSYTDGTSDNLGKIVGAGVCAHEYGGWTQQLAPSCSSIGYDTRTCNKCGVTDYNITQPVGHSWNERISVVYPSCIKKGLDMLICTDCRMTMAEELPLTEHDYDKGVCKTCGALKPSEGLEFILAASGRYYSVGGMGTCSDTKLIIPTEHDGLPVSSIADKAFKNSSIEYCYIPDTVDTIGEEAFAACAKLKAVEIRGSLTEIKKGTFFSCISLTEVAITDTVRKIGETAFASCRRLNSLALPEKLEIIERGAFEACDSLTSVEFPQSLHTIGERAFFKCGALTSVVFADKSGWVRSVVHNKEIVWYENINEEDLNNSQKIIQLFNETYAISDIVNCYYDWTKSAYCLTFGLNEDGQSYSVIYSSTWVHTTRVFIPPSYNNLPVTAIGERALRSVSSYVEYVFIPDTVTSIGRLAFYSCRYLKNITLPEGVTTIEDYAFANCRALEQFTVPSGIKRLGRYVMLGCASAKSIYYNGTIEEWCDIEHLSSNSFFRYAENFYIGGERVTKLTIPKGVTEIPPYAFSYCRCIEELVISEGVKSIGGHAFYNCRNLKSVKLPDSLVVIEKYAFGYCESLESISIPCGVELIEANIFFGCDSLSAVSFENKDGWVRSAYYKDEAVKTEALTAEQLTDYNAVKLLTEYYSYNIPEDDKYTHLWYVWTRTAEAE